MGNFRPLSDLDRKINRAKRLPGPGEYDINPMTNRRSLKTLLKVVKNDSKVSHKKGFNVGSASNAVMEATADDTSGSAMP